MRVCAHVGVRVRVGVHDGVRVCACVCVCVCVCVCECIYTLCMSPFQGKVEVQIEILTEEEARMKPAGKGRDEPNQHPKLDKPNRPETSFFWLTSPLKSFKYIIWKYYKCHIIGAVAIILLVIALAIFIYTAPVSNVKLNILLGQVFSCTIK